MVPVCVMLVALYITKLIIYGFKEYKFYSREILVKPRTFCKQRTSLNWTIPWVIYQIGDDSDVNANDYENLLKRNSKHSYKIFSHSECQQLLDQIDFELGTIFWKVPIELTVMRSNICRYAVIYECGGIYIDIGDIKEDIVQTRNEDTEFCWYDL